jgi:hypothetical protein
VSLCLFLWLLGTLPAGAEDAALTIVLFDAEQSLAADTVVYEGGTYELGVGTIGGANLLSNVTVTLPWATVVTSEDALFLNLTAPSFEQYETFWITATKPGYTPGSLEVTVLKGRLLVTASTSLVSEGKAFILTVTDQQGFTVADARLFVGETDTLSRTNATGQLTLTAPEVDADQQLRLTAIKPGYEAGAHSVFVSNIRSQLFFIDTDTMLQLLPVIGAIFAVVAAIGIVRWRHGHSPPAPLLPTDHDDDVPPTRASMRASKHPEPCPSSRVEEIRIPVGTRQKETTVIATGAGAPNGKRTDRCDWFQGTDYMRCRVDELTGTVDSQKEGKWFVGHSEVQAKVDETLKKKKAPPKEPA